MTWYVDDIQIDANSVSLSARDPKESVRVATTANLSSLSGEQTIDGVSVITGNRVLVKNQDTAKNNGIYVCDSGVWARSLDADVSEKVTSGCRTYVEEGSTNAKTQWVLTTPNPIVLGTTDLTFEHIIEAGTGLARTKNSLAVSYGSSGTTACVGNDGRLSDDRTASGLRSATTVVSVSSATAPSSGQVLTATGSTAATWQTPTGGGSNPYVYKETITSWTSDSGLYRKDVAHNIGTTDVTVQTFDASTLKNVGMEEVERLDANTVRIWSATQTNNIRVIVAAAPTMNVYTTTISAWTPDSGQYYADVVHSLNSTDVVVSAHIVSSGKTAGMEEIERTDANTVRIRSATNGDSIRVVIFKVA